MSISPAALALTSFTRSVSAAPAGSPAAPGEPDKKVDPAENRVLAARSQRERLEQLQAEFRAKVMRQRNLTDDVMANLTARARAELEQSIVREAAEQMRTTIGQADPAGGQDGPAAPQVLDIKV